MWRVMWRQGPSLIGSIHSLAVPNLDAILASRKHLWADLSPVGDAEPIFLGHPAAQRLSVLSLPDLTDEAKAAMDLAGFFHVFVASEAEARKLVGRLRADPDVNYAEMQARLHPAVRFSETRQTDTITLGLSVPPRPTPDLTAKQAYLGPAPVGIDALYAWTRRGGRGAGVQVVDVENGWNFNHEDLKENAKGVVFGGSSYDFDHGTAVLGIFSADQNAFGVTGIASDALLMTAAPDWGGTKWNAAGAIKFAADRLKKGDVILLEMHAPGPNSHHLDDPESQQGFVAVEYWLPEFQAIQFAVAKGINVVEAAGNGGENYDDASYQSLFSRAVRDSGAILVGAGQPSRAPQPRSRIDWSNCGSRLDVQGWGLDIVTTGGKQNQPVDTRYYDLIDSPDSSRCYTQSFGGTSGASPMVVGAVACISGAVAAAGRAPLTPSAMRQLLVETGTPQTDAPGFPVASDNIGPLPNLRAALSRLALV